MKRSIHIEAPVEKVFDLFKDPRSMLETLTTPFVIKDVKLTKEGVGTYYSWASKTPGLRMEGFDVYTEFVPNQRITDRSSSGLTGDWTLSFEPEGSGDEADRTGPSSVVLEDPALAAAGGGGPDHDDRAAPVRSEG